jgi:hypothetical protein
MQDRLMSSSGSFSSKPPLSFGPVHVARELIRAEGGAALWKGVVPTCLGMVMENAVAFAVNEQLKRSFPSGGATDGTNAGFASDLLSPMLRGFFTGLTSSLVLIPSEIIKTKTQVSTTAGVTSWTVTKSILSRQGVRGLFCGLDAQFARDGPFYAVFFGGYDAMVRLGKSAYPDVNDEALYFACGGFAGMLGWLVAMPFDVPKTIVQGRYDTKVFGSYWPVMGQIVRERGIRGLYAGLGPTLIRAFPSNAALFLGVEMTKKAFDQYDL